MQSTQFNLNPVTHEYEFAEDEHEGELLDEPEEVQEEAPLPLPAEAITPEYHKKDQELYSAWAADKSKKNMTALVNHLMPLVHTEVRRASGSLPTGALKGTGVTWAIKAVKTYDPSKGAALGTHVMSYLRQVRRVNYKHQNSARLPEHMQRQYQGFNRASTNLTDELNRDPTDDELAKELGWTKGQVVKFRSRLFADDIESSGTYDKKYAEYSDKSILMNHLREQLTHDELVILDNNKVISSPELAKKLGVDVNRLNYMKRKLTEKIKALQTEIGYE